MKGIDEEFLTVVEFAKRLKVAPVTIYRAINSKRINSIRIGRIQRIPVSEIPRMCQVDLEEYINQEVEKRIKEREKK